jgi:hypothetical protein
MLVIASLVTASSVGCAHYNKKTKSGTSRYYHRGGHVITVEIERNPYSRYTY